MSSSLKVLSCLENPLSNWVNRGESLYRDHKWTVAERGYKARVSGEPGISWTAHWFKWVTCNTSFLLWRCCREFEQLLPGSPEDYRLLEFLVLGHPGISLSADPPNKKTHFLKWTSPLMFLAEVKGNLVVAIGESVKCVEWWLYSVRFFNLIRQLAYNLMIYIGRWQMF